jgi:hypothetical protein
MTPQEFTRKWRPVALTERQTAQEHFGDLCRLLGQPTPIEADPEGIDYAFEKGASRATGGRGWADVWSFESVARDVDTAWLKSPAAVSGASTKTRPAASRRAVQL